MQRITMNSILKAGQKSLEAVNAGIAFVEDAGKDLVSKILKWDEIAAKGREHLLWALAAQVEHNMDVEDWSFGKSLKPYFEEFDTPEAKAFSRLDKGQQLKIAKAWSEVVAGTKKAGKSASDRRKARKPKKGEDTPRTYRQVLAEAKALSPEEQNSLLIALAKELGISTKNLKVA